MREIPRDHNGLACLPTMSYNILFHAEKLLEFKCQFQICSVPLEFIVVIKIWKRKNTRDEDWNSVAELLSLSGLILKGRSTVNEKWFERIDNLALIRWRDAVKPGWTSLIHCVSRISVTSLQCPLNLLLSVKRTSFVAVLCFIDCCFSEMSHRMEEND